MFNKQAAKARTGKPRVLIVGGVAGGASCAARARRLSEDAEIIVFERGPHVSFASCGLPYYVGNVIAEEKDLLVATPELFKSRFDIQVRLRHEVLKIDRNKKEISVRDLASGKVSEEIYDALVLSPGTTPIMPPVPGIDLPGIFMLRTIKDSQSIKQWMAENKTEKVAIIGGGFIGLETAENLAVLGKQVSIIELLPQVMGGLDPEIAVLVQQHLASNKIELQLGDGVVRFEKQPSGAGLLLTTRSGKKLSFDMVLLATGVRPETTLAGEAGLETGKLGGIRVNERMQTSDKNIYAVGDAVEVKNVVSGEWQLLPLAGPASRQGRIAADVIMGRDSAFRGVQGTMICKIFGKSVAMTGVTEKSLNSHGPLPFEKVYLHPGNHAGYYPGAESMTLKLVFSSGDGRMLGAQAFGGEGVDKRIDVISMAIQKNSSVYDLEEAEMCYAPQFGSAKDPVNMAGMVAANVLRGESPVTHWNSLKRQDYFILDVRNPDEYSEGHYEGATNIPLPELRSRLSEIPAGRKIGVYCAAGIRSYIATRILKQRGFDVENVSGGMITYKSQPG